MDEWYDSRAIDKLRIVENDVEPMAPHRVDVISYLDGIEVGRDIYVRA